MIYIKEDKPTKISGVSSLYISFKFHPDIVNIIKESGIYNYDKKTFTWEVPTTSLATLLDNLTYIDDISLSILDNGNNGLNRLKPVLKYKTKPFKHQEEAIEYGLNNNDWLLLDEPGLGKTKSIINLAEELKNQKGLQHCLIICGIATLRSNWEKEIELHSDLTHITIGKTLNKKGKINWSTIPERANQLRGSIDEFFIIMNVETLRSDEVVEALKKSKTKIDMVVIDEVHKCLSSSSLIETDQGKVPIKELFKNKTKYLIKTSENEYNKLKEVYKIPNVSKLIKLEIKDELGYIHTIKCTPDHKIFTHNRGYIEAKYITEEDELEIGGYKYAKE